MNKLKHFLPGYILKTMYNSLIMAHFNSSVLSWGFDTNRLSKLQKRAIIIISHSKYNSRTELIMKSLNLLKIEDIFTRQCLTFFHSFMHKRIPIFFNHYFCKMLLIMIFPPGNVIKSLSHTVILRKPENVLDATYQLYLQQCHHALWIQLIRIVFTVFLHTPSNTY